MVNRLPVVKARTIMRVLHSLGFTQRRQTGSHIFYQHADGRTTLVPRHDQEDIGRGLLRQILREAEITPDEFLKHV